MSADPQINVVRQFPTRVRGSIGAALIRHESHAETGKFLFHPGGEILQETSVYIALSHSAVNIRLRDQLEFLNSRIPQHIHIRHLPVTLSDIDILLIRGIGPDIVIFPPGSIIFFHRVNDNVRKFQVRQIKIIADMCFGVIPHITGFIGEEDVLLAVGVKLHDPGRLRIVPRMKRFRPHERFQTPVFLHGHKPVGRIRLFLIRAHQCFPLLLLSTQGPADPASVTVVETRIIAVTDRRQSQLCDLRENRTVFAGKIPAAAKDAFGKIAGAP